LEAVLDFCKLFFDCFNGGLGFIDLFLQSGSQITSIQSNLSNEVINELGINLDSGAGNSGDVAGEEAEDLDGGTGPDIGITNSPSCMPCFVYYLPFY